MHITDFNKGARLVVSEILVYFIGEDPKVSSEQSLCPFKMNFFYCSHHNFND